MDLLSPSTIKKLLARHNTRPSKGLGQNFLIDKKTLGKIMEAANLSKNDTVLEIGPGVGTLTQELAHKAGNVMAIEKDAMMVEILKETLGAYKNVEVINKDILKISNLKFKISNSDYKVVCNIPYYLTSPLIRKLLESKNQPAEIILMVQKEVAQRICAKPPEMSLLAVSVQFYAKPEIISYVSKNCFWPAPKVDSAIIKITPREARGGRTPASFFKTVKAGFSQPRKQLLNNLSHGLKKDKKEISAWLAKNGIKPQQRAETLTIQNWLNLVKELDKLP